MSAVPTWSSTPATSKREVSPPATVARKLVVLTGFYRYCIEVQLLEHSPAVHVRRPKIPSESPRLGLDRAELGAFLVQAGLSGGNDHVLACLLPLTRYGFSAACGADLNDLALAKRQQHPAHRWQGQPPSADPARSENDAGNRQHRRGRTDGPLLARGNGSRLRARVPRRGAFGGYQLPSNGATGSVSQRGRAAHQALGSTPFVSPA
jgi:hypothetical protein